MTQIFLDELTASRACVLLLHNQRSIDPVMLNSPLSEYQLLNELAQSISNLPDEPIEPVQDVFGTFLALWIECLETDLNPTGFQTGLAILRQADVGSAASMRWATQKSLAVFA